MPAQRSRRSRTPIPSLQALAQLEDASPIELSADIWALRSQAFVRLKSWDQGLRYISLAIRQAESDGLVPQEQWLLSQTALKWKLGDLEGAARSLQRSIEIFPKTHEGTFLENVQFFESAFLDLSVNTEDYPDFTGTCHVDDFLLGKQRRCRLRIHILNRSGTRR